MTNRANEYAAYFQTYNPSGGGYEEWDMWCQAFVARCSKYGGGWVQDYETAEDARNNSGWLDTDWTTAPIGAIFYWDWSTDGHVAVHYGDGWLLMGSRHVDYQTGGVAGNAGSIHFTQFQAKVGLNFAGWSLTNGGNVVPMLTVDPPPSIPVPAPVPVPAPAPPPET